MSEQPFDLSRLDDAHHRIGAMCKNGHPPRMSIPARPEHDDDLVICKTLEDARKELTSLRTQLTASREREGKMRDMLSSAVCNDCRNSKVIRYSDGSLSPCPWCERRRQAISPPSDGGVGGCAKPRFKIGEHVRIANPDIHRHEIRGGVVHGTVTDVLPDSRHKFVYVCSTIGSWYENQLEPLPPPPTQASATSSEGGEG